MTSRIVHQRTGAEIAVFPTYLRRDLRGRAMTEVRDKVAQALFRADDMVAKPDFAWGETTAASYAAIADAAIAAHLEALGSGGHVVVKLPESQEREADDLAIWWDRVGELRVSVHDRYPDEVGMSYDFEPYEPLSVDEARTLAATLMAAAAAAESGETR